MRSSSGVIVTGDSKCALDTCVLENTDDSSYTEVRSHNSRAHIIWILTANIEVFESDAGKGVRCVCH
eukprot:1035016-Rhodomonas_salina.2